MNKILKKLLFFIFCTCWSLSLQANTQYLLTFDQLKSLNNHERSEYLEGLRDVMLAFGNDQKSKPFSWQSFFFNFAVAQENVSFRCVEGGVPVRLQEEFTESPRQQQCGTNSYAGLTCSSGNICNPYVFGVNRDGSPVCMASATTQRCFDTVVTGQSTFFPDDLFDSDDARNNYNEFLNDFEALCNGDGNLLGGQRATEQEACDLARRQLRVNLRRVNREARISLNNPLLNEEAMGRTATLSGYDGTVRTGDEELAAGDADTIEALDSPTHIYPNIGEYLGAQENPENYEEFLRLYRMFGNNPELQNSQRALVRALAFYSRNRNGGLNSCAGGDDSASENLRNQEWITISDLTLPSSERRIFFLNTRTGEVISDWSSHGSGSNGRGNCTAALREQYNVNSCNDIPTVMGEDISRSLLNSGNSNVTRGGFYEVAYGIQGPARWGSHSPNAFRLRGLQSTNEDAVRNGVQMHGASYVSPGSAGRSWGCPTMQRSTFRDMRNRINNGSLLYLHTINEDERGLPEC